MRARLRFSIAVSYVAGIAVIVIAIFQLRSTEFPLANLGAIFIMGLVIVSHTLMTVDNARLVQEASHQRQYIEAIDQINIADPIDLQPEKAFLTWPEELKEKDESSSKQPQFKTFPKITKRVQWFPDYAMRYDGNVIERIETEKPVAFSLPLDLAVLAELRQLQEEGKPNILRELVEAFQFEAPLLLQVLEQAIIDGKPEKLQETAYNLKGRSSSLGALTMGMLSADLEVIGKQGTVNGAMNLLLCLKLEYQRVRQALAAAILE